MRINQLHSETAPTASHIAKPIVAPLFRRLHNQTAFSAIPPSGTPVLCHGLHQTLFRDRNARACLSTFTTLGSALFSAALLSPYTLRRLLSLSHTLHTPASASTCQTPSVSCTTWPTAFVVSASSTVPNASSLANPGQTSANTLPDATPMSSTIRPGSRFVRPFAPHRVFQ